MEYEGGVDLGAWDNRLSVGLTGSWKTTQHELIDQQLGFDGGAWIYEENVGDVRNTALEASVNAMVIETRAVTWSVTVSAAMNHNKLLRVDPGFTQAVLGNQRQAVGYPLYGYWGLRYHYADRNHDGIIAYNEVTFDTGASYAGSSIPTQEGSLATHIGLLHNTVTIGATFSYAGGYRVLDAIGQQADGYLTSFVTNNPRASLADQARVISELPGLSSAMYKDGTYVSLDELSLTYMVPERWTQALRAHSLSVTGAVRHLALWSRFPGADPRASNPGSSPALGGTTVVNNDVRLSGDNAVPLVRTWFVRVNVGW
jgi:hypothetical protein